MTEEELVQILYAKYGKTVLNRKEVAKEIGMSLSKINKLFGGKNALSKKVILKRKILPIWHISGKQKKWTLVNVAKWILNTEEI